MLISAWPNLIHGANQSVPLTLLWDYDVLKSNEKRQLPVWNEKLCVSEYVKRLTKVFFKK